MPGAFSSAIAASRDQPRIVAQLSTFSAPYCSFQAFNVLWLPPLVSMMSPVFGFLYCFTLRARLTTGAPAALLLVDSFCGSRRAITSFWPLPYCSISLFSFSSNSSSFFSLSSFDSELRRSVRSRMVSLIWRYSCNMDIWVPFEVYESVRVIIVYGWRNAQELKTLLFYLNE